MGKKEKGCINMTESDTFILCEELQRENKALKAALTVSTATVKRLSEIQGKMQVQLNKLCED